MLEFREMRDNGEVPVYAGVVKSGALVVVDDKYIYRPTLEVDYTPSRLIQIINKLEQLNSKVVDDGPKKHSHYYKDVSYLDYIDVYRVCRLFDVNDAAISHALKKLLVAGGRGAGKDIEKDIGESIDTLVRWQGLNDEDKLK